MEVIALAASCFPMSFLYLLHHMLAEAVVELHELVALPSMVEGKDENLLASILVSERC
jgi:hypothetical protein